MRGPSLVLDGRVADQLAHDGKPLEHIPKSGRLAPEVGGTGVIHDAVTTVTVDRDGTAHFHDAADVDLRWDFHIPTPNQIKEDVVVAAKEVARWYADPYAKARVGTTQDVPRHLSAEPGDCDHWDDACSTELRERDQQVNQLERNRRGSLAHGKLDITALLMRATGVGDPFASRKRKLLDDTFAERADLGAQHTADDLARSAELMQRNLEALWRTTSDPAERRSALFTLWDECSEGDGADGEAGQRARGLVIGWIRSKLPPGSTGAFTADDIATLSAHRTSHQPFVPYE